LLEAEEICCDEMQNLKGERVPSGEEVMIWLCYGEKKAVDPS